MNCEGVDFVLEFLNHTLRSMNPETAVIVHWCTCGHFNQVFFAVWAGWYKSAVPCSSVGVWVVPFVQFYMFPMTSPLGINKTAPRVQIPYTLEAHDKTITCSISYLDVCRHDLYIETSIKQIAKVLPSYHC